jgi:hypothetical protein
MNMTKQTLVVVPCGKGKIWDRDQRRGPTAARHAYVGAPFKVNRECAERFAERWVILSAKYGFVDPDFIIPGPYNVTFKDRSTRPVSIDTLRQQARGMGLDGFPRVVGLGGREYREAVAEVFRACVGELHFPFAGLAQGKAMSAVKRAVGRGIPGY